VPFHIVGNCGDFWRFFFPFSLFLAIQKTGNLRQIILFPKYFSQNGEDSSPEKSLLPT
jgi:hypothetical protein